jgi:hypothetical protein
MKWPMNYYFTWYLLGIFALIFMQLSLFLPRSIQRRKREPKTHLYTANEVRRPEEENEDVEEEGLIYRDEDEEDEDADMNRSHHNGHRKYENEERAMDNGRELRQVDSERKDEEVDLKVAV